MARARRFLARALVVFVLALIVTLTIQARNAYEVLEGVAAFSSILALAYMWHLRRRDHAS